MKAMIICDDFTFVVKARATLQRVGSQPEVGARWTIRSWPVNALHHEEMAEKALAEAADAHLIVIPASRAHSIPSWLRDWLRRWAAHRLIPDAAVAVIGDGADPGINESVSPELTRIVREHALNFFANGGPVARDATQLAVRFFHEPRRPLTIERSRYAAEVTRDSFRCVGINE